MSGSVVKSNSLGEPVDSFGRAFSEGATVLVTAVGYGAKLWHTQGKWTVVKLGPKRAVLSSPMCTVPVRIAYECLTVLEEQS